MNFSTAHIETLACLSSRRCTAKCEGLGGLRSLGSSALYTALTAMSATPAQCVRGRVDDRWGVALIGCHNSIGLCESRL